MLILGRDDFEESLLIYFYLQILLLGQKAVSKLPKIGPQDIVATLLRYLPASFPHHYHDLHSKGVLLIAASHLRGAESRALYLSPLADIREELDRLHGENVLAAELGEFWNAFAQSVDATGKSVNEALLYQIAQDEIARPFFNASAEFIIQNISGQASISNIERVDGPCQLDLLDSHAELVQQYLCLASLGFPSNMDWDWSRLNLNFEQVEDESYVGTLIIEGALVLSIAMSRDRHEFLPDAPHDWATIIHDLNDLSLKNPKLIRLKGIALELYQLLADIVAGQRKPFACSGVDDWPPNNAEFVLLQVVAPRLASIARL
jgi:hypothetical protein